LKIKKTPSSLIPMEPALEGALFRLFIISP